MTDTSSKAGGGVCNAASRAFASTALAGEFADVRGPSDSPQLIATIVRPNIGES